MNSPQRSRFYLQLRESIKQSAAIVGAHLAREVYNAPPITPQGILRLQPAPGRLEIAQALARALLPDFSTDRVWLEERDRCMIANGWAQTDSRGRIVMYSGGDAGRRCDPLEVFQAAPTGRGPATPEAVFRTRYWNPDDGLFPPIGLAPRGAMEGYLERSPTVIHLNGTGQDWIVHPSVLYRYYLMRSVILTLTPFVSYSLHGTGTDQEVNRWLDALYGVADRAGAELADAIGGEGQGNIALAVESQLKRFYVSAVNVREPPRDEPAWYEQIGSFFKANAGVILAATVTIATGGATVPIVGAMVTRYAQAGLQHWLAQRGVMVSISGTALSASVGGGVIATLTTGSAGELSFSSSDSDLPALAVRNDGRVSFVPPAAVAQARADIARGRAVLGV